MSSLTDRYVFTVLRQVPEPQRADLERELRSSIADLGDARRDGGASESEAETAALQELGDPDLFAAGIAGRRQYLIGPELYSSWLHLLRLLLTIIVPIAAIAHAAVLFVTEAHATEIIAGLVGTAIEVALYSAAAVTIIFALLERAGTAGTPSWRRAWSPDQLPEYARDRRTVGDLAFELVWVGFVAVVVLGQQFWSFSVVNGSPIPVLAPAEWSFWWPYFLGILVVAGVFFVWTWRSGGWTLRTAGINTLIGLAAAIPLIWLASQQRLWNPGFTEALGWTSADGGSPDVLVPVTIACVVVCFAVDAVQGFTKARGARAGVPAQVPGTGVRV